ncbi:MAG: ABC transporter permease subunit [Phycisphaerales bacterium]
MSSSTTAIARRDFASYFLTPAGYIITALYLLFTAGFFIYGFQQGQTASMRPVFEYGAWLLLFIGPAITMRMMSEEMRMGTMEMLITAPLREREIVLGKFIAALAFLFVMLLPTAVFVVALELYGRPDYGELGCGYLGLLLAGTAYIASGIFASTTTGSQVVAFLLALFFWLVLSIGTKLLPPYLPGDWGRWLIMFDPDLRFRDFAIGLVDTANIVFFLGLTVVFLVAATKSLEARRWR